METADDPRGIRAAVLVLWLVSGFISGIFWREVWEFFV